jgi:hypothetical protein
MRAGISYTLTETMDDGRAVCPWPPLAEKLLDAQYELVRRSISN